MLAAWLHDLNPVLFRISGDWAVRWYGVSYLLGFVVAWWLLRSLARRALVAVPASRAVDAIMILVFGVLAGGRLGYVLFYKPHLLWSFSPDFPFWEVLAINRGGMASHGGMIGVVLAAWAISRGWTPDATQGPRQGRCSWLHALDITVLIAPPGLFLGRLANFVNGELLGKIVAPPGQPAPWWAVKFPQEQLSGHAPALRPEQFDALNALVADAAPSARSFDEGYRVLLDKVQHGSVELAARLEPLISARHPSQLYQAFAEGVVVWLAVWVAWRHAARDGVATAWFLISYGVLRVATEFWRLPDADLTVQRLAGLSRGQWLSVVMIVCGIGVLWATRRWGGPKFGTTPPSPMTPAA